MRKQAKLSAAVLSIFFLHAVCNVQATERDSEIRQTMWNSNDPDFAVVDIPTRWSAESAVIISALHSYEYKKAPIISELNFNENHHYRIKLLDKNAVNHYAEISFNSSKGRSRQVYAGFKVIKPDGKEIIVNLANAVEMERKVRGKKSAYRKIAIPNLEPGDILDYYISEENIISLSAKLHFFEPVLFHLPQEYPVIKQKLKFDVQRRCFINLRSMNGAPELKQVTDEASDTQYYYLEDDNRDKVEELRWFYPYRELPSIKFRAAYASGKAIRQNDVLLGEPGVVKSRVTDEELTDFMVYLMTNTYYSDERRLLKYAGKNHKKEKDPFVLARQTYFYQRNQTLKHAEAQTIGDFPQLNQYPYNLRDTETQFCKRFSYFLANMEIPYELVVVIPRNISSLEDLLIENELDILLRVKKGNEYLYLSPIEPHSLPGDIQRMHEGADAYVFSGLSKYKDWEPKKISLPVSSAEDNITKSAIRIRVEDDFSNCNLSFQHSIGGNSKAYHQYSLLDYYDYRDEEKNRFEIIENFEGYSFLKKRMFNLRDSYLDTRDQWKMEVLRQMVSNESDFEISDLTNFEIQQTGRYIDQAEMVYSFDLTTDDLLHKVGRNYLLDVGKLIGNQVKVTEEELERDHGVHMSSARSFKYSIELEVPEGYTVQGLDKLQQK